MAGDKRRVRGTKKTAVGGITFDSKREAERWGQLKFLEQGGEIRNLQRQVPVGLVGWGGPILTPTGRPMKAVIDFVYEDKRLNWATVYEDAKGHETDVSKMKRAILSAQGIEVVLS
ncbi:MAG: hypothetical protein CML68_13620 [Rhodobacteraceae bacterium]|nr:hypothetical protein [Paracoccaceae bacterium]